MAVRATVLYIGAAAVLLVCLQVESLRCWECSTYENQKGCQQVIASGNASRCEKHQDVCVKIVTNFEEPNSGPRNRTAEQAEPKCQGDKPMKREVKEYVSKLCGEKVGFKHFAKVDKRCTTEAMGGGGTQTRCMCSGNECNAARGTVASVGMLTAVILSVSTYNYGC